MSIKHEMQRHRKPWLNGLLISTVLLCGGGPLSATSDDLTLPLSPIASEHSLRFKLSLQGIQSNFTSTVTPLDGNNSLPIQGMTTPVILDIAIEECEDGVILLIEPVQFEILAKGFMISETSFPVEFAPRQALFVTFNAGPGLEGHVFRNGSIRFSGPGNTPLTPGTYRVRRSEVEYSTVNCPCEAKEFSFYQHENVLVRDENFPISKGQSHLTVENNLGFDYGEYFGIVFNKGEIFTVTTDNSFDNMQTPIAVFNAVDTKGRHLIPQVDVVPPSFARRNELGETTLTQNPTNLQQFAATFVNRNLQTTIPRSFVNISDDGGRTWRIVDPFVNVPQPFPTLPGFGPPLRGGDFQIIYDGFGNLFYAPLMLVENIADPSIFSTIQYVLLSSDGGNTWKLLDSITGVNPATFGLDYPIIATGKGPNGSQVTWLMLKQDASFDEILGVGSTFPLMTASYQMTGLGTFKAKRYQEVPGSNNGGFGTITVGPEGDVLLSGMAVNNTLGSLPFVNNTLWTSYNRNGFGGNFNPIEFTANTDAEIIFSFSFYLPMQDRGTWAHPTVTIDNNGRWYLLYLDQPTTHAFASNPNLYLIFSDDKGKHWSTPVRINNDVQNITFHVNPNLALDRTTNDLAIAWLDTREDQQDISTRVWATVIKNGSLQCFE